MRTYTVITVHPASDCRDDGKPDGYLWQYDYGQRVCFGGVDLPPAYEVHFSNTRGGESLTVIGDITGADIPDELLLTGQDIHVWLYLHHGETDGETVKYARIAVRQRAKPTHETPTPVQQDEITQVIAALDAAVDHVDDIAEAMPGEIQAALQEAKDSGEFDGPPGPQGEKGDTGAAGADGISPAASVSKSGGVATITVTDADGTTTAEIYDGAAGKDGKDGKDGADGADGFSPSASVSKSGSTATITITDKTGTTTASVQDGADGQDGYTPVRGTDYWTAADQAQILEDVEDALIDDAAAAGDVTKVWSADKSSSEVSSLKSAKAPCIFRDASGDIVSITDGADGMPLKECVVSVDPVQDLHGQDSPYPAGGGVQKWDEVWAANLTIGSYGNNFGSVNFVPVIPGETYYFVTGSYNIGGKGLRLAYYDANKELTSSTVVYSASVTIPSGCYFIKFGIQQTVYGTTYLNDISINYPSTDHNYHPYSNICPISGHTGAQIYRSGADTSNPTVYPITFPDSAGTVYGGTVDLAAKTLTVDRASVTFNGEQSVGFSAGTTANRLTWNDYPSIGGTNTYFQSDTFATSSHSSSIKNEPWLIYNGNSAPRMFMTVPTTITSVADWNAYVAEHPITVVYYLATPLVYSLTDLPTITTLPGYNAIWADTGAISLIYPADTKTYVDDHTPVQDVQIDGTSILNNGVANVPIASSSGLGVAKISTAYGIGILAEGILKAEQATSAQVKAGTQGYKPIVPERQHESIFYGLAKAAGADMASVTGVTVGTYPEAQKIAIQKMLGIYQAPWELIREDTVTNATEADINITVDGNGQAFELTDVIIVLIVPTHSEDTTIGDFGRVYLYNNATEIRRIYLLNSASKLVQANSTSQIAIGRLLNNNGMMIVDLYMWTVQSNRANLQIVPNSELNGTSTPFAINANYINTIKIGRITGKLQYRLYGRRKWN